MPLFPGQAGSYVLYLRLDSTSRITVGSLGSISFPAGSYLYAGSACGPGGLRTRLSRHLDLNKVKHWHIDYLRPVCTVLGVIGCLHPAGSSHVGTGEIPLECRWSRLLTGLPDAGIPAAGFGSRDCRSGCKTHLVYLTDSSLLQLSRFLTPHSPAVLHTWEIT